MSNGVLDFLEPYTEQISFLSDACVPEPLTRVQQARGEAGGVAAESTRILKDTFEIICSPSFTEYRMARCHIYNDSKASAEKLIQRDQIPSGTDRI